MNCAEARGLVSAALDREPVDATMLEQAKQHCRSCRECNDYVRVLATLARHEGPEPPEWLVSTVMAEVREDAALRSAAASVSENTTSPTARIGEGPTEASAEEPRRPRRPMSRTALAAWSGAAAVLLISAGALAITGVRQILVPQRAAVAPSVTEDTAYTAAPPVALSPEDGAASSEMSPASSGYIVVDGVAFKYAGIVQGLDAASLKRVGTVTSAFDDPEAPPRDTDALGTQDPSRVYVSRESTGALLSFDRITRTYDGRVYVLKSGPVERFGDWPRLPSDMSEPMREDGSPTFAPLQGSTGGATVYRRVGDSAEDGIAIAPGSPVSDPAGGNPYWTWWEPLDGV